MKRYIRSSKQDIFDIVEQETKDENSIESSSMIENWDEEKKNLWSQMNGSTQTAVEYATQYIDQGYSGDEAVQRAVSDVNWGNVEPEYEDEEFYGEEVDERQLRWYLELCYGSKIFASKKTSKKSITAANNKKSYGYKEYTIYNTGYGWEVYKAGKKISREFETSEEAEDYVDDIRRDISESCNSTVTSSELAQFSPAQIAFIDKCIDDAPEVPYSDPDDSPEEWSAYWRDAREHKHWSFVDGCEAGLFADDDYAEFKKCWDALETRRAEPFA